MVNLFNHDPLLQPRRLPTCDEYNSPNTPKLPFPNDPFHTYETYIIGWILILAFAILATFSSGHLIYMHLTHYRRPEFQRPINRILLMVPVYAIISALSYRFYRQAVFFHVIRDAYESFVLWCFFGLLLQYLGPDFRSQRAIFLGKPRRRLPPPACCFMYDPSWRHFLHSCKFGIIQYIVVKISTTIAAVVLELNNMYCPESMSPSFGHFWITLLNAFSVGLAMFTLFAFYLAVSSDLVAGARSIGSSAHPIAQFLSIKFVIFFGFWQGFIVKILVANGTLHGTDLWTAGEVSSAVQSFLVCLEMALASVLHNWAFSWRDFDNAADPDIGGGESMGVSMISNEPGHMGRSESMEQMLPAHYSSQYPPEEAFSSDEPHSRLSSSSIEHPHGSHRTSSPASSAAYLKEPRPPTPFWPAFQDSFNWFDLYYDFVEVVKFVLGRVWSIANKAFLLFCMCQMCRKRPELRLPDENDDVEDDDHLLFEN